MNNYRYKLEKYSGSSSRYECPNCNEKEFTKYVGINTRDYIADYVGRCNRVDRCGYHYTPKSYFDTKGRNNNQSKYMQNKKVKRYKPTFYFPREDMSKYFTDNLINKDRLRIFLKSLFPEERVEDVLKKYLVGGSKKWDGATVFFQIDEQKRVRTGKVIQYNSTTGKRIMNNPKVDWIHDRSDLESDGNELRQCLFGLHLLKNSPIEKPIAIVESEKTAIICSLVKPEYIWMATGSEQGLKESMLRPLNGRRLVVFPDVGAEDAWKTKLDSMRKLLNIDATLIPLKGEDNGIDLADVIVRERMVKKILGNYILKEFRSPTEDGIWSLCWDEKSGEIEVLSPSGSLYDKTDFNLLYG